MKIKLSPVATSENDTPPSVQGAVLSYRGINYDLSQLPKGAEVEADEPFVGKIKRDADGEYQVTLQYRYSTDTAEPTQSIEGDDYIFEVPSGDCPCPIERKPTVEEEEL